MIFRDEITPIKQDQQSDGMGGFTVSEISSKPIKCKASFNTSPEKATSYGLACEQVLYIASPQELDKEAFYLFNGKKYQIRFQTNTRRIFYSTFVEVKEDSNV